MLKKLSILLILIMSLAVLVRAADITDLEGLTGKIGKEDVSWGTGQSTDTFTVPTYDGSTVTLTKLPTVYTDLASTIKGIWYPAKIAGDHGSAALTGSLAWVISQIGATKTTIELPGSQTYQISTNLTIPSTVTLRMQHGAVFSIDTGKILTINGTIEAPDNQIFTGLGTVTGTLTNAVKNNTWFSGTVTDTTTASGTLKKINAITSIDTIGSLGTVGPVTSIGAIGTVTSIGTMTTLTSLGTLGTLGEVTTLTKIGAANAQGDVYYHNGTKVTNLAAGTKGQFLQTQGAAANTTWGSPYEVRDTYRNLVVKNNTTYPGYKIDITADSIMLLDASNTPYKAASVSVTIDLSTIGANGLDTGAFTADTWYHAWVIYNSTTTTVAGLLSASSTAPTLPTGYTYKAYAGPVKNWSHATHLHFDGADAGTTFTDVSGKTWTAYSSAQTVTTTKKFGTASGYFSSGTSDYIDTPDSGDFTLGIKDFTIEGWIRRASTGAHTIIGQCNSTGTSTSTSFIVDITIGHALNGTVYVGASASTAAVALGTDTASFHHFAFVRKGDYIKVFVDGVGGTAVAVNGSVNDSANRVAIGRPGERNVLYLNGYLDELSMTVGEAKYWADFTAPTVVFADKAELMQSTQKSQQVQLGYSHLVSDNGGSTTTSNIDLSSVVPSSAIGVSGKTIANTGALDWSFSPATFSNSIGISNGETLGTINIATASIWSIPMLTTAQTMYHQVSANTVDVYVSAYTLP